jgi:putative ABC transport system permease protein
VSAQAAWRGIKKNDKLGGLGCAARSVVRDLVETAGVPLAWLLLVKLKGRFLAAIAGIAFAVTLALVELGFQDALFSSITQLYSHFNAELVLISPFYQCMVARETFPEIRLYQALGDKAVQSVAPIYMETLQWTNPVSRRDRFILVVGFKPVPGTVDLASVDEHLRQIGQPGGILFDEASRPEFGPVAALYREQGSVTTELSRRRVEVVGLFRVGASFANSGHVITSDTNFLQLMPTRESGQIDVGLIKLTKGSDADAARDRLAAVLPPDVAVLTKARFLERERAYWSGNLPIGFIFRASLVMSLVVGAVVVYQILYSGVSEHLAEYATLKAVGYSDRRLFLVVLQEALILSVVGFIPGLLLGFGVYAIVRAITLISIQMTFTKIAIVYPLTALMCSVAGALAMRRLRSADPADIF